MSLPIVHARLITLQNFLPDPFFDNARHLPIQRSLDKIELCLLDWLAKVKEISPFVKSMNNVFKVKWDKITIYIKIGRSGEKTVSKLERTVWEIACILGDENYFAPTGKIKIPLKRMVVNIRNSETTDLFRFQESENYSASFQKKVKGKVIRKYITPSDTVLPKHIKWKTFIKAFIISIVYGMRDAHSRNIFFSKKGKIIYFDNACSLSHSNKMTQFGNHLYLPFRSGFFNFDDCYKGLNEWDKKILLKQLLRYKSRLPDLKAYFETPKFQKRVSKFLPGWFYPEESLEAMGERIRKLIIGLEKESLRSLADLACYVFPYYRFFTVLSTPIYASVEISLKQSRLDFQLDTLKKGLILAPFHSANQILRKGFDSNLNVYAIKSDSRNFEIPLRKIIKKLLSGQYHRTSPVSPERTSKRYERFLNHFYNNAVPDHKDVDRRDNIGHINDYFVLLLKRNNIPFEKIVVPLAIWFKCLTPGEVKIAIISHKHDNKHILYKKTISGSIIELQLDIYPKPGIIYMKVEKIWVPYSNDDFIKFVQEFSQATPETTDSEEGMSYSPLFLAETNTLDQTNPMTHSKKE